MALCACSSPISKLEKVCREKAGVTIYDPIAWATYITKIQRTDLEQRQADLVARSKGALVRPKDASLFASPNLYVPGYERDLDHDHFYGQPQPGPTPQRNDVTVVKGGRKIAVVHDFEVGVDDLETFYIYKCSENLPELYGIRRSAPLL